MVRKGRVITPRLAFGILPGVARGEILRHREKSAAEQDISVEEIAAAEEVFVTNALLGVMPVVRVDQQMYRKDDYVVTRQLMTEFGGWQAESFAG